VIQPVENEVWQLIKPGVEELGLRIVRVRFSGGTGSNVLQVMVEPVEATKENPVSATVGQCASISRMSAALLDVEDTIPSRYTLEVSSTGMERPLVSQKDFADYANSRARIQMAVPFNERRRFIGMMQGIVDDEVVIVLDEDKTEVKLPFEQIKYAHLYFTDEDMKQIMNMTEE
jgi:ribosome maturation factor RimP